MSPVEWTAFSFHPVRDSATRIAFRNVFYTSRRMRPIYRDGVKEQCQSTRQGRSAADVSTRLTTDRTSLKLGNLYAHHLEGPAVKCIR